jgi:hypothetical protein
MRLDRVILKDTANAVAVEDMSHFANHGIPDLPPNLAYLFPSDHYGIKLDIQMSS